MLTRALAVERMESAMAVGLTPQQETVMRYRLGLATGQPLSLLMVSVALNMDVIAVSRAEREALTVLSGESASQSCPECGGGINGPHESWCSRRT